MRLSNARAEHKDEVVENAASITRNAALRYVVSSLSSGVRRNWPHGNAEWTQDSTTGNVLLIVELGHTDGSRLTRSATISKQTLMLSEPKDECTRIGRVLGSDLVRAVREYEDIRQQQKHDEYKAREFATPKLEQVVPEEVKAKLKTTYGVGKLGPICLLCGPENRDKYPDWSTCPHGVKE